MSLFHIPDSGLFRADSLSWVMAGLILFVIANVTAFSSRYLAGDRNRRSHHIFTLILGACVLCMVFADHLLVLLSAWAASNLILVKLMVHKAQWTAARNAGLLAMKTFGLGFVCLTAGFWLLAEGTGTASIHEITKVTETPAMTVVAGLCLIAIAAMTQSAAWPFHRWLISSLNSPTPVSALMHAGLVNGGGFLLVRFAPIYANQPGILHGLFVMGLITAVVGTFWKLVQTDIKRMLACSTMGQMGFMLMQCGMGLFAPAVSHLCWHGLFKAYLFLNAGSAVQEKRNGVSANSLAPLQILGASIVGLLGATTFVLASGTDLDFTDTGCLMVLLAFMASTQLALGLLDKSPTFGSLLGSLFVGMGAGGLYGLSIRLIETTLGSLPTTQPQPIDAIYLAGFAILFLVWIAMLLNGPALLGSRNSWKRLYMATLNASQPHPKTVTVTRTSYQS